MNPIHEYLTLRTMADKPNTYRYRRMAEGCALTKRHKRILTATKWIAGILFYGGIISLLIWALI
jgi:hypothetical protein